MADIAKKDEGPVKDQAVRLVVEWDGRAYVARSVERVAMRVPGVSRFERGKAGTGRFVEVRGRDGAVLHRQAIDERLPDSMSYPTGDPNRPTASARLKPGMTFSILVPAHPKAAILALVEVRGTPKDKKAATERAAPAVNELLLVPLEGGGQ
jgi:hypothetical protein